MTNEEALEKAKSQLSQASYKGECLNNRGLATAYNNKAEWLSKLIYCAELGITALREQAERDNPQPLTLDELREMDGEPVWITSENGTGGTWALIRTGKHDVLFACCAYGTSRWAIEYCKTWLAYRHKPKEADNDKA